MKIKKGFFIFLIFMYLHTCIMCISKYVFQPSQNVWFTPCTTGPSSVWDCLRLIRPRSTHWRRLSDESEWRSPGHGCYCFIMTVWIINKQHNNLLHSGPSLLIGTFEIFTRRLFNTAYCNHTQWTECAFSILCCLFDFCSTHYHIKI